MAEVDWEQEARKELAGVSIEELLRTAYRITHIMHDAREGSKQDLRDQRDMITAEIIRRSK